jgi:hypothetical protein
MGASNGQAGRRRGGGHGAIRGIVPGSLVLLGLFLPSGAAAETLADVLRVQAVDAARVGLPDGDRPVAFAPAEPPARCGRPDIRACVAPGVLARLFGR